MKDRSFYRPLALLTFAYSLFSSKTQHTPETTSKQFENPVYEILFKIFCRHIAQLFLYCCISSFWWCLDGCYAKELLFTFNLWTSSLVWGWEENISSVFISLVGVSVIFPWRHWTFSIACKVWWSAQNDEKIWSFGILDVLERKCRLKPRANSKSPLTSPGAHNRRGGWHPPSFSKSVESLSRKCMSVITSSVPEHPIY